MLPMNYITISFSQYDPCDKSEMSQHRVSETNTDATCSDDMSTTSSPIFDTPSSLDVEIPMDVNVPGELAQFSTLSLLPLKVATTLSVL